ncbi:hypothetical protein RE628_21205 [Paenibacillus sp. D2_2]|uniref:hypothetical protein n=1 Tax=Paenibacillus sp. D2_2 TaxID=3073092 RepID=UPI002815B136|nr:hypothetical protein [Paenibacillus sp. D2_2]WMT39856.1 hypothetical protein RE628_21205 [Paenibacillus sp. D2_2]
MTEEQVVIGAETKFPLNGILTLPKENDRLLPAVVLVHGSGPNNMDEKIGNNYPFKDLAEGLSEQRIAVLRYDKRTFVYSKEMGEHPASSFLKTLNKPVFILQGDKDFQVSIEKDFNSYRSLLNDMTHITFKRYENLNHLFMPSVYGEKLKAKKEYKVAQLVDKQVIDDVANWILSI